MKKPHDLKLMSTDELWSFHELVSAALAPKISAEKARLINDCVSFVWAPGLTMLRKVTRGAHIRRFIRNIETPRSRPKLGRAAERSHAGWPHSLIRGNGSMISGSIWRRRKPPNERSFSVSDPPRSSEQFCFPDLLA
jgi:hypothetical protein